MTNRPVTSKESFSDEALLVRFAPLFEQLSAAAADNERSGTLPIDLVRALGQAGLGALRIPQELGGSGSSLRQLFFILRHAAAADSNIPQALRQHYFQVEQLLLARENPEAKALLGRVVAGDFFGNATTEPHGTPLGEINTVLRIDSQGGYRLRGRKIYGTGNRYAQWIPVAAVDEAGRAVVPIVPVSRDGVVINDDWNGFGQRLTATDSIEFRDVHVAEHEVRRHSGQGPIRGGSGLHQTVLLAALAGTAEGAAKELQRLIAGSKRAYFTGTGAIPRHDPVVQTQLGYARATADSAAWILDGIGRQMDAAWNLWSNPEATVAEIDEAFIAVELAVASAQVTLTQQVIDATAHLQDVLGASSLNRDLAIDRFWRNARALASHNPAPFKARMLGDYWLNGTLPPVFVPGKDVGEVRAGQE